MDSRITRPHPEAVRIAQQVGAILKAEDTGEYRREVLLQLNNIENNQRHQNELLTKHIGEDKEKFDKQEGRVTALEVWQNRIIGALLFIVAIAGIVTWMIDKFGGDK